MHLKVQISVLALTMRILIHKTIACQEKTTDLRLRSVVINKIYLFRSEFAYQPKAYPVQTFSFSMKHELYFIVVLRQWLSS